MKLAIMQPYLLPYIGYYQLIKSVDVFLLYDNVEYVKQSWINRNRLMFDGRTEYFNVPVKKDSDYLAVSERKIAGSFPEMRAKLLRKVHQSYRKAPCFEVGFSLLEECMGFADSGSLFEFVHHSLQKSLDLLGIHTEVRVTSSLDETPGLKGQDRVLSLCELVGADVYVNAPGGRSLYHARDFSERNIELLFLEPQLLPYQQGVHREFTPGLSIIDVLMWNSLEEVSGHLEQYNLVGAD